MVKAKKSESDSPPKPDTNKSPKQSKEAQAKKEIKNGGSAPKKVTKKVSKGSRSSTFIGKFFIVASVLAVVVSAGFYLWLGGWEDGGSNEIRKKLTEYSVSELFDHGLKALLGGGVTRDEEAAQENIQRSEQLPEKEEPTEEKSEPDDDETDADEFSEPSKAIEHDKSESEKPVESETPEEVLLESEQKSPHESESETYLDNEVVKSQETVEQDTADDQQSESQENDDKFHEIGTVRETTEELQDIVSDFQAGDKPNEEILYEIKDVDQQLSYEQEHAGDTEAESTGFETEPPKDEYESPEPQPKTFEEKLAQDQEIIDKIGDISASEYYKTIGDTGREDYKDTVNINKVLHKRHKTLEGDIDEELDGPFEYYGEDEYEEEEDEAEEARGEESPDEQIETNVGSEKENETEIESDKLSVTEPEKSESEPLDKRLEFLNERETDVSEKQTERDEFENDKQFEPVKKFEVDDETETSDKADDDQFERETEAENKHDTSVEFEEKQQKEEWHDTQKESETESDTTPENPPKEDEFESDEPLEIEAEERFEDKDEIETSDKSDLQAKSESETNDLPENEEKFETEGVGKLEDKEKEDSKVLEHEEEEAESKSEDSVEENKNSEEQHEEAKDEQRLEIESKDRYEGKDETETSDKSDVQVERETNDLPDVEEKEETEGVGKLEDEEEEDGKVLELEEKEVEARSESISEESKDSEAKNGKESKLKLNFEEGSEYQNDEEGFYTDEEDSQIVIEVVEELGQVSSDQSEAEEQDNDSEDVVVLKETGGHQTGSNNLENQEKEEEEGDEEEYRVEETVEVVWKSLEDEREDGRNLESFENETSSLKDKDDDEKEFPEEQEDDAEDEESKATQEFEEEKLGREQNDEEIKKEPESYDAEKIAKEIDQKIDDALKEIDERISKNARSSVNHYHTKLLSNIKDNFAALGKARALTAVWKNEGLEATLEDARDTYFLLLSQPPLSRRFSYIATAELVRLLEAKKEAEQEGLIKEALQTLLDMYPDHLDEFNDLALTSLKEGGFETAKVAFRLVLSRHPSDSFARLYLGSLLKIVDRDFQTAVDLMLPVVEAGEVNIGDPSIYLELGDALSRLGRKEEAKHVYHKAVDSGLLQSPWQHNIITVPGLSNRVWWSKDQLSERNQRLLTELENYWFNVREELENVLAGKEGVNLLTPLDDTDHVTSGGVEKLSLFVNGEKDFQVCNYLPSTCRMIENIPDVAKCQHCQAQIYVVQPNTRLSSFISPTNARIRADLGLSLARDDLILVRGERRSWQLGRFLLYDPSFDREWVIGGEEEEDEEPSNQIRSVSLPGNRRAFLSLELWHPELTEELKQSPEAS